MSRYQSPFIGQRVGNYQIEVLLDAGGGMADVYRGKHMYLQTAVAIKVLKESLAQDSKQRQEFEEEARRIARLNHPNIVQIHDYGFINNQPFLVMPLAKGSLKTTHGFVLQPTTVQSYLQQIGDALQYAHERGIVHRDLKPANFLIGARDEILLSDFGIATITHSIRVNIQEWAGTPHYMPPEQWQNRAVRASDQYSLGICLYQWICGDLPFAGDMHQLMYAHLHKQVPSFKAKGVNVSPAVESVVMRALSKDPAQRFENITAFVQAFAKSLEPPPPLPPDSPTVIPPKSPISPLPRRRRTRYLDPESRIPSRLDATRKRSYSYESELDNKFEEGYTDPPRIARPLRIPLKEDRNARSTPTPSSNWRLNWLGRQKKDATSAEKVINPYTRIMRASLPDQKDMLNDRQLFTVLDVGTAFAKAILIEAIGEQVKVLGVGYHPQTYNHMSDGVVTDLSSVITNCNEALLKAEKSAGGVTAPSAIVGIAGELVKGSSITVSSMRQQPTKPITSEELDGLIMQAQKRLLRSARERIASETGYPNIDVRLTNSVVVSARIDGQVVANPIGFKGRNFSLILFSAFAPLTQLGALESIALALDLGPSNIISEPYALTRCLSTNANAYGGAIFIDVGGGTTDIALARQGGIEETRMFALGGRTFTRRIAASKDISITDAERIKLRYSKGEMQISEQEEIQSIIAPDCQTWMDIIELLISEIAKGELLPPVIYLVGGGSTLPDLHERLESFPWTERLPFSRRPVVHKVQPEMVTKVITPDNLLTTTQDITLMALAYQAVELQNGNTVLASAVKRVTDAMHI